MKFRKYNSIENSYQSDFMQLIAEQGFADLDYVVQEKVHGGNLSLITNGEELISAKRTGLNVADENFYNFQSVVEAYRDKVFALFADLQLSRGIHTLTIFGELFGGAYPHADVEQVLGSKMVQQGIYYAPHNDFYAFDVLLDDAIFLGVNEANALFEKHGFIYARTLFSGSLSACLAQSNTFRTTIPALFGLPELEGNICEGLVIRPLEPVFMRNGSRVLIKNKNERWSENNNYIDKALLRSLRGDSDSLSEECCFLCEEIYRYITVNRLDNVLSKIGEINVNRDLGRVLGLFNKDVLSDFLKDFQFRYDGLEKQEQKAIGRFLNSHSSVLLNERFKR